MSQDNLSSWKEIATYLKCDESTARRWEQKNGLPIHRIGNRGGSVYAFSREIDAWLRNHGDPNTAQLEVRAEQRQDSNGIAAPDAFAASNVPAYFSPLRVARSVKRALVVAISAVVLTVTLWKILRGEQNRQNQSSLASSSESLKGTTNASPSPVGFPHDNVWSTDPVPEDIAGQLKMLVKNSQIWEMLTLYATPWNCDARDIQQYWLPGSSAFLNVAESASRLNERSRHYGFGARLLDFEYRYVRISQNGLSAEVGTREHWWLPVYQRGTIVADRNPDQGPYEIDYLLSRKDGRWYLSATTTPYSQWKPRMISCQNWPNDGRSDMAKVATSQNPSK